MQIGCPDHGNFWQVSWSHLNSANGCPECGVEARSRSLSLGADEFVGRARAVHGDTYDYAQTIYVNANTKVVIICGEHGAFEQAAGNHLTGSGCPRCAGRYSPTTEEWIAEARKAHGDRYYYSQAKYEGRHTKLTIVCLEHGPFEQAAGDHVRGIGCSRCAKMHRPSTDEWIELAREVHGDRYDYSETTYINQDAKVTIVCSEHGAFDKNPRAHIEEGTGCPLCPKHKSRGETAVAKALTDLGVRYEPEWRHETCGGQGRGRLRFDFNIPEYMALIEFDGSQHFRPVRWNKSITREQALRAFIGVQLRDRIKDDWARVNGYPLLRVSDLRAVEHDVLAFLVELEGKVGIAA